MRRFSSTAVVSLSLLALITQPLAVFAQDAASTDLIPAEDIANGFDPDNVLNDRDMFEIGNANLASVQAFLQQRGTLGFIKVRDIDGVDKPPSEIIWRVATSYHINPNYLMALIQKEQSLVEDPDPSQKQLDWAAGFGVCDSCSMNDPRIQAYKGFANQIEYAAKQHRERYLFQLLAKGTTVSGYAPGKITKVDDMDIKPANNATAMLYTYTPHIHGNLSLWHIWRRWFSLSFPDGTFAQGKTSKNIYLLRLGQKRKFTSKLAAASMVDTSKIVQVEDSQLSAYPDGPAIAFANYSIIETEDGKRYLLSGDEKRLIVSLTAFRRTGFVEDDVVEGTKKDLEAYADGKDITTATQYPTGLLAKGPDKKVWYIEDGIKQEIVHAALLNLYFKGQKAKALTDKQLATFKTVEPYAIHDGELVKGDKAPDVFVVENGVLRPITSGNVFEQLGWQWRNVVKLPQSLLDTYEKGGAVELQNAPKLAADL